MTSLYQGAYDFLSEHAEVGPLVAASPGGLIKVFNGIIPQKKNEPAVKYLPCIVFSQRGFSGGRTYCADDTLVQKTVVLDCYGVTWLQMDTLGQTVKKALRGYRGAFGATMRVRDVSLSTEFDLSDFEPGLFRISQTWLIWHSEE